VTDSDEDDDAHTAAMIEYNGADMFVLIEGRRIAKRGRPGTPQAGTWIVLEPGFVIHGDPNLENIIVEFSAVSVH
jgi:hypothetical protein